MDRIRHRIQGLQDEMADSSYLVFCSPSWDQMLSDCGQWILFTHPWSHMLTCFQFVFFSLFFNASCIHNSVAYLHNGKFPNCFPCIKLSYIYWDADLWHLMVTSDVTIFSLKSNLSLNLCSFIICSLSSGPIFSPLLTHRLSLLWSKSSNYSLDSLGPFLVDADWQQLHLPLELPLFLFFFFLSIF